jgi:hypothetical protein
VIPGKSDPLSIILQRYMKGRYNQWFQRTHTAL